MKQITNKEYEEWQKYKAEKAKGHILLLDRFSPHFSAVQLSCIQFLTGGLFGTPIMLFTETLRWQDIAGAAVPILYAGVLSCGAGYTLQIIGQKNVEPTVASILLSLESVFAAIFGALILHEGMTARELLGCVLMFAAIVLAQLPAPKRVKREKRA